MDGLRALAALWVAVYHVWVFFYAQRSDSGGPVFSILSAGHLGVPLFLSLSGFCLTLPYVVKQRFRVNVRGFAIRRALRILPPYYITLAALAVLQQVPFFRARLHEKPTDLPDLAMHLLLVHNLSPDHVFRISGPFWSIALECQLYLVFPVLLIFLRRPLVPLAVSVAVGAAWWVIFARTAPGPGFVFWNALPSMLPVFMAGALAALLLARGKTMPRTGPWLALCLLGLAVWLDHRGAIRPIVPQLIIAAAAFAALLSAGSPLESALSSRPLLIIGGMSYTVYLIHNPIISLAGKLASGRLGGAALAALAALSVLVSLGTALLLYRVMERPFHALARKLAPEY